MSCSKFRQICCPCIPVKNQDPDPNAAIGLADDPDANFWQDGNQVYSKRQVSKAVAVVLSGYDLKLAASSIDANCDPATVDLWMQLYKPAFFEDGMACPPALVSWWMDEMDRKKKLGQPVGQISQQQQQPVVVPAVGNVVPKSGPSTSATVPQNSNKYVGTPYSNGTSFMTSDGTVYSQTVTTSSKVTGNTIVISSPSASQPNVRVFYQPDPAAPQLSPMQQKQAEDALISLQNRTVSMQGQSTAPKSGRPAGPPYQIL